MGLPAGPQRPTQRSNLLSLGCFGPSLHRDLVCEFRVLLPHSAQRDRVLPYLRVQGVDREAGQEQPDAQQRDDDTDEADVTVRGHGLLSFIASRKASAICAGVSGTSVRRRASAR